MTSLPKLNRAKNYLLLATLCLISQLAIAQQDRPNILWLTFEDTSPQFIGCYGNSTARTPFMDSLSKIGTRFTRAFATGTVCSPSRTALITGMKTYTLGTGHHRSNYPIPDFVKGFPYYLKKAVYYCSNNSKTDYNVANPKAFITEAWNESSNTAGWWDKESQQPFFAVFNNASSHQSRTMSESYDYYEKNVLALLPKNLRVSEEELIMPPIYRDSPKMRKHTARIYNSIALADYEMKQIYERLKKDGLAENTILFCFADHGEGMPRVKTNGIGMGYQVPFFIVIPEKFKKDFPFEAGTTSDQLFDFCDLPPTVLQLAKVEIPAYFQGKSIIDNQNHRLFLSSDRADESNDLVRTIIKGKYAYSRSFMPFMQELRYVNYIDKGDITMQIRKDFEGNKLNDIQNEMLLPRSVEYLYDYEKDRWQTNNLALDKNYENLLIEFRNDLKKQLIEKRDIMFLPESEFNRVSEKTTLYEFRKSAFNYPIEKIVDVAMLSGLKTETACNQQINLLTDADLTVQYWAAIGLKSQDKNTLNPHLKTLQSVFYEKGEDNAAKVVLATVLSEKFDDAASKKYLEQAIFRDDEDLSWLALQLILYQSNRADFEQIASSFLSKFKDKTGRNKSETSAHMLLYALGKEEINPVN